MLVDSLVDVVHALMMEQDESQVEILDEKLWRSLYYKVLTREDREVVRNIIRQVLEGLNTNHLSHSKWHMEVFIMVNLTHNTYISYMK